MRHIPEIAETSAIIPGSVLYKLLSVTVILIHQIVLRIWQYSAKVIKNSFTSKHIRNFLLFVLMFRFKHIAGMKQKYRVD